MISFVVHARLGRRTDSITVLKEKTFQHLIIITLRASIRYLELRLEFLGITEDREKVCCSMGSFWPGDSKNILRKRWGCSKDFHTPHWTAIYCQYLFHNMRVINVYHNELYCTITLQHNRIRTEKHRERERKNKNSDFTPPGNTYTHARTCW